MLNADDAWLADILIAARHVKRFVVGIASADDLDRDPLHRSAVIHQLVLIGEAAKQVSAEFRQRPRDPVE